MLEKPVFRVLFTSSFVCALAACNGNSSPNSYDTTTAGIIGSSMASTASQSDDSTGSFVAFENQSRKTFSDFILPKAFAASCDTSAMVKGNSTCGGATVMTLSLNSCTAGQSTWTGTDTLTFNSTSACTSAATNGLVNSSAGMGASNAVVITSASPGIKRSLASGASVSTTSDASGYGTSVSGGTTISCSSSGCSSSRTLAINGIHRLEYATTGAALYDHSLSTPTAFTVTGLGSSRQIVSGTLQLQHNLLKYTATAQITTPLAFTFGCCFPTSGVVNTTFTSGSKSGTETMTFTSACGIASIAASGGTTASVTMTHCL